MIPPSTRTRAIVGVNSGTGNVRRSWPPTFVSPFGPRSVSIQNSFAGSPGVCQRSLPRPPSMMPWSFWTEPGSRAFWTAEIGTSGNVAIEVTWQGMPADGAAVATRVDAGKAATRNATITRNEETRQLAPARRDISMGTSSS